MTKHVVLFPGELFDFFDEAGWGWGFLNLRVDQGEGVVTVAQAWHRDETVQRLDTAWQSRHYLRFADVKELSAVWYRAHPDLHTLHDQVARRRASLPIDLFKSLITQGWIEPGPVALPVLAVTTRVSGGPQVTAWRVTSEGAAPDEVSVVDGRIDPLDLIANEWPVAELHGCKVAVIGVGSIGSMLADTLARSGIGHLALLDFDRLEQRNLARHLLTDRDLGRHKVLAMKDLLEGRTGAPTVEAHTIDVLTQTEVLRPIVAASDVVICAADGVAARRVCNHVSRRASTPLVIAAVLEDGAFGEVIRVRQRTGCLHCLRLAQVEAGAMDPEPGIDLGYGTGTTHRPMTAAPSDLQLVADLASKMTLSTLLEARGRWEQRLPGDYAIVGLQPKPDYLTPFDIACAGDVRWHALPARRADCPTCAS